ncbi:MAG: chromophore lyase CpcT/CpeT [Bacteroidota bacterium]
MLLRQMILGEMTGQDNGYWWDNQYLVPAIVKSVYLRVVNQAILMLRFVGSFLICTLLVACSTTKSTAPAASPDTPEMEALVTAMTGSFNSSAQARANENYYHIVLHMEPIWTDQPGHYLYVEQAVAADASKPYRQRVYVLEQQGKKKFISSVYELPEPERFVGAHKNPALLDVLKPADLIVREGCAVYLKQTEPGMYRGSTKKDKCKSTLRGASYATSRVSIAGSFVQSWDQGFDAEGQQVWGATEGGYMFFRE